MIQYISTFNPLPTISKYHFTYWLLWPFGALLYALKHFNRSSSKTLFWMFCVYFGLVFIYSDPFGQMGADSARYAAKIIELNQNPLSISQLLTTFYNVDDGIVDIYVPLTSWIISLLTGNPRWLFMFFAAVFGYFYTQNLWLVYSRLTNVKTVGWFVGLFMLHLALVNPIWNINGVRMWTAAHIFLYGILTFYLSDSKKGLIWALSSILFHFSFFLPVLLFVGFIFVPRNVNVLFGFFLTASLINEIDMEFVRNSFTYLPVFLQSRVASYTSEAYIGFIGELNKSYAWHVKLADTFGRILLYIWVIISWLKHEKWGKSFPEFKTLFTFALYFGGFAKLLEFIPSGGRFMILVSFMMYSVFIIVSFYMRNDPKVKIARILSIPFLIFYLTFAIRVGFDYIGISTFVGNPIFSLFVEDRTPIIQLIKQMF